jgi:hypothetical protein
LQWHGIRLNHAALDDSKRRLAQPEKARSRIGRSIASLQQSLNDLSDFTASRPVPDAH